MCLGFHQADAAVQEENLKLSEMGREASGIYFVGMMAAGIAWLWSEWE
jgi:hypothetical protein